MLFYENDRLKYKIGYRKKTGENGVENWRRSQDYSEISLTTRRTPSCFWLSHRSCTQETVHIAKPESPVTESLALLAFPVSGGFYRTSPRSPWGQRKWLL